MKSFVTCVFAVVVACLANMQARAQGTNTWADGYPKTGTAVGSILYKGVATADEGWEIVGSGSITYWPVGGGVINVKQIVVDRQTGVWGEGSITGLISGREYNLVANVHVKNLTTLRIETISSDPKTAKAK